MRWLTNDFIVIAITSPEKVENEAEKIGKILQNHDADILHIRKPTWTMEQVTELLQLIPPEYYSRIKLHDHFSLIEKFPLLGVHVNSRNYIAPKCAKSVSRSFHALSQLNYAEEYDYVTLSPIFDSISKAGYNSPFSLNKIRSFIEGKNVIALGGVTPDKFPALKEAGFYGGAMLGYFWN